MHVIINILFYCKLRNIYGLKWTTTSKRSSPPRGREWKICLNMKVVKWVAAHTGMFIKRSVKTGKRHAIDRRVSLTARASAVTVCVCVSVVRSGCSCVSGELRCNLCDCFCFHGRTSTVNPPNQRVCVSRVYISECAVVHAFIF